MDGTQAKQVLGLLLKGFRRDEIADDSARLYTQALRRFDVDVALWAVERIAETDTHLPSIERLVVECQAQVRRLETYAREQPELGFGTEAWTRTGLSGVAQARAALEQAPATQPDIRAEPAVA